MKDMESAFPVSVEFIDEDGKPMVAYEKGLTALDYFASAAMKSLLTMNVNDAKMFEEIARLSYKMAEEMMKIRAGIINE